MYGYIVLVLCVAVAVDCGRNDQRGRCAQRTVVLGNDWRLDLLTRPPRLLWGSLLCRRRRLHRAWCPLPKTRTLPKPPYSPSTRCMATTSSGPAGLPRVSSTCLSATVSLTTIPSLITLHHTPQPIKMSPVATVLVREAPLWIPARANASPPRLTLLLTWAIFARPLLL